MTGWPEDRAALQTLYREAFPDEDLWPLVTDLAAGHPEVLSLYAQAENRLAGHVAFTRCPVGAFSGTLLGPLCVTPKLQKTGIGSKLVETGLARLRAEGVDIALVLGDPNYYGRFGFRPGSAVPPPYPIPEEWQPAWQDMALSESGSITPGDLILPGYWMKPELWSA